MRLLPLLCASALLSVLLPAAFAQSPIPGMPGKAGESPAETANVVETRIAIADIPYRADKDERDIQKILGRSASDARAEGLASGLQEIARSVDNLGGKYHAKYIANLPIRRLESLERHWRFLDDELSAWYADLQAAIRPLSGDAAVLAEKDRLWNATRVDAALSPPLVQRIDDLLSQINTANAPVSASLARLIELDERASAIRRQISAELAGVSDLIKRIDRDLARIDSPTLWTALAARDRSQPIGDTLIEVGVDIENDFSAAFDKRGRFRNLAFSVVGLLLLPAFIWLSRRARKRIADGTVPESYANSLTRPISAWLLLLAMGELLLNAHGPMIRLQTWLLLAWIPVMRLLPKPVFAMVRPWMILSALFFALNLVSLIVTSEPLLFRLVILVNGTLMLITLVWLLYRPSTAIRTRTAWQLRALRILLMLGIGALAIAILANIIGNVSLAAMLTDATLNSGYIGMFIFAVATVIGSFFRVEFSRSAAKLREQTHHAGTLLDVGSRLFGLAMLTLWVLGTLSLFRVLRPLAELLGKIAAFTFGIGDISVSIGGIVVFLVSIYLTFWTARTVRSVLAEDLLPGMSLPRGVANSVSTMSYYVLVIAGMAVALAAAGLHVSELAIVLGALSVGIGFGLQDVVKNFVSGLILMIERPVQPGDTIELSGTIGKVREIGMRATTLTTFDGADVVVPNGMLLADKMTNWTLSNDKRRVEIPVGVAYGNEPEAVLALLSKVATSTPGVSREPPPRVLFTGFGQSSLDFSVRAWTDSYEAGVDVRSALGVGIHAALKQAGIEVPFPQQDLHIRSVEADLFRRILPGSS